MNQADLNKMSEEEVKQIANDLGVPFHHNAGKSKVIALINAAMDGNGSDDSDSGDDVVSESVAEVKPKTVPVGAYDPKIEKSARQKKQDEAFEKKHPELDKKIKQLKEDDRNDSNLHTALQKHQPHASASKEIATVETAKKALEPLVARGLHILELTDSRWHLRFQNREDSGNMKMPISTLYMCASLLLRDTHTARDTGANPSALVAK